jgi:hypothetical protein
VSKKKKVVVVKTSEDGLVAPIEEQPSILAKSIVLGAQLMEENDALRDELAELKAVRLGERRRADELAYWKKHARRFWGRWHVTVKFDLTPWSWSFRPQFPKRGDLSIGIIQFWWLFLCIEAIEA